MSAVERASGGSGDPGASGGSRYTCVERFRQAAAKTLHQESPTGTRIANAVVNAVRAFVGQIRGGCSLACMMCQTAHVDGTRCWLIHNFLWCCLPHIMPLSDNMRCCLCAPTHPCTLQPGHALPQTRTMQPHLTWACTSPAAWWKWAATACLQWCVASACPAAVVFAVAVRGAHGMSYSPHCMCYSCASASDI